MAEKRELPKSIEEKVREIKEKGRLNYESPRVNRYSSKSKNIIAGTIPSDERIKENVEEISSALSVISALTIYNYNWKGTDIKDIGLIAQELEKVYPDAVKTLENGLKVIDYQKIIVLLIGAIKEIKQEIEKIKG
ncbi:MAG: tail fiber domain-containing protein [candidate division WOR-3 bacterium]|nr:tail fiber domain-containing protein [candidate division WOR-3 bacterium]MCX7948000.1 tail fiber domain-containing protein [candidate division WOR-3 bacterium]MDW8151216.1 tail fiber domain-containing protein [candidate division WOR-3 bacterium]